VDFVVYQSLKREYQQDVTVQMFIVNFRFLLLTTVSTCFGHHYAHDQENKDRVLLHMVFALVVLDVAGCSCGALRCGVRAHSAHRLLQPSVRTLIHPACN